MSRPADNPKIMPLDKARQTVLVGSCYDRSRGMGKLLICNTGRSDVQQVKISAECGDAAAVLHRDTFTIGPIRAGRFLVRPFPLKRAFPIGVPVIDAQVMEVRLS